MNQIAKRFHEAITTTYHKRTGWGDIRWMPRCALWISGKQFNISLWNPFVVFNNSLLIHVQYHDSKETLFDFGFHLGLKPKIHFDKQKSSYESFYVYR